jgi:hypothetical protein
MIALASSVSRERALEPFHEAVDDPLLAVQRGGPDELGGGCQDAVLRGIGDGREHGAALDPGLRGDAAAQEAGAADLVLLDEGHGEAEVVGVQGRCVDPWAPSDDDDVVHGPFRSVVVMAPKVSRTSHRRSQRDRPPIVGHGSGGDTLARCRPGT